MSYQQLTQKQRYQISFLIAEGYSQNKIAIKLDVNRSTIHREIKRNSVNQVYNPDVAISLTRQRRVDAYKYRIPKETIWFVEMALLWDWSPEQISNIAKSLNLKVSHEWIYRYVLKDKIEGGTLYQHLRQGHKKYRKGKQSVRGKIRNCVSIDERPSYINDKSRLGDWEADLVLGQQGTGAIVTLAERKSRLYLIKKVPNKGGDTVKTAIIDTLKPYKEYVKSITFDNGLEFSEHLEIAKELDAKTYFAHPYSSWERGLNENFNGLLRQYVPKGTNLKQVEDEYLQLVQERINKRPRKCLGYKQPLFVFNILKNAA